MERCWTYSHSPTPPACGQTDTPNFFAMSKTAMTSLTPPRRQASIWQNEMAFAWNNCLKMMRFWQCSPVATPTGATAFAIAAWPSTSSGLVGSSIQYGSNSPRRSMFSIASPTSQTWFASSISLRSGPISSRTTLARLASSSISRPTLILTCPQPASTAFPRELPDQLVRVPEPACAGRVRRESVREHLCFPIVLRPFVFAQDLERLLACDRVGYVAEVHAGDDLLGAHVREELPEGLALALGVEVPYGVDDRGRREVDHTFLRPDPPELAVSRDVTPESAHVLCERLERPSDHERG